MKLLATGWVTALLAQPAGVILALTLLVVVLIVGGILVWVLHGVPSEKRLLGATELIRALRGKPGGPASSTSTPHHHG